MREERGFDVNVCVTGQHREMLQQVLQVFDISPDTDLNIMVHNQTLGELTGRLVDKLTTYVSQTRSDYILVQGDTTTAFCAALAAFYNNIPVGHVEAGLRTWNLSAPFPEEANRQLISRIASLHFAPTEWSANNLRSEGIPSAKISVTGNTVIDALHIAERASVSEWPSSLKLKPSGNSGGEPEIVLITGHRRENFGAAFESICNAIVELADRFSDVHFVYPVHLNPNVREPVFRLLSGRENIHLIDPLSYLPFIALMKRSKLILTDSGGIQEEAPGLGKPVLVMRETTERPEGVEAGTVMLVGTDCRTIVARVSSVLQDRKIYAEMSTAENPYGDGHASRRICDALLRDKLS